MVKKKCDAKYARVRQRLVLQVVCLHSGHAVECSSNALHVYSATSVCANHVDDTECVDYAKHVERDRSHHCEGDRGRQCQRWATQTEA